MRHNPYQTGLLAAGGFALVLASILMVVVSAQTDYLTYDVEAVGELRAWTYVLCSTGAVAFIGAAVLAGMRWMLRNAAPALPDDADERMPAARRTGDTRAQSSSAA